MRMFRWNQPIITRVSPHVDNPHRIIPQQVLFSQETYTITDTDNDGQEDVSFAWTTAGPFGANIALFGVTSFYPGAGIGSLHYENIKVAQGTVVTSAIITAYIIGNFGTSTGKLQAEDIDNATPASAVHLPSGMTLTTAETVLSPGGWSAGDTVEFDVTDVVNEVFARPSWAYENNLNILTLDNGSGAGDNYFSIALVGNPNSNGTPLVITQ